MPAAPSYHTSGAVGNCDGTTAALLAIGSEVRAALEPLLCTGDQVTKVVHCRQFYSAALFSSGTLYAIQSGGCRSDSEGASCEVNPSACEPSMPKDYRKTRSKIEILPSDGRAVVDVAAGDAHLVYCTDSGAVYSTGYANAYGQLGDGTVWSAFDDVKGSEPSEARCVPNLSPAKRIHGFGDAEAGIDQQQPIPSQQQSVHHSTGQCGSPAAPESDDESSNQRCKNEVEEKADALLSSRRRSYLTTTPVVASEPIARTVVHIRAVSCGAAHTLLLTKNGNCVYACGRGDAGQLGARQAPLLQPTFRAIRLLFGLPIKQILAAGDHSFVLLHTGKLFAFGSNVCGQLGTGNTRQILEPTPVRVLLGNPKEEPRRQAHRAQNCSSIPLSESGSRVEEVRTANGTRVRRARNGKNGTSTLSSASRSLSPTLSPPADSRHGLREGHSDCLVTAASAGDASLRRVQRALLDAKTYSSLRAPYASIESTHFPLRAHRLDGELEPKQPFILSVWGCASNTVILTGSFEWYSCGLPLTKHWQAAPPPSSSAAAVADVRYDSYGALGRPLHSRKEAYRFGPMAWTPLLKPVLSAISTASETAAASAGDAGGEHTDTNAVADGQVLNEPIVACFSYPHATYVQLARRSQGTNEQPDGDSVAASCAGTHREGAYTPRAVILGVGGACASGIPVWDHSAAGSHTSGRGDRNFVASSSGCPSALSQGRETPPPLPHVSNDKNSGRVAGGEEANRLTVTAPRSATANLMLAGLGLTVEEATLPHPQSAGNGDRVEGYDHDSFKLYVLPSEGKLTVPLRDSFVMVM